MRFRFGPFVLSPAHRVLRRGSEDVPLIARYFDLLVLLVAERQRVVTRQEIFDRVWADVVVSDGALSQAIRTIRRCLEDDPREPRFIRTVSRHGYQFVGPDVSVEADDGPMSPGPATPPATQPVEIAAAHDPFALWLGCLLRQPPYESATDEERREAAERLHALGTAETLERLDGHAGHAEARAILRDARWDVPGAGEVPLLASPHPWDAVAHLLRLRARRAARHSSNRWRYAATGGTLAGLLAGAGGGVALWLVPESQAHGSIVVALGAIGAAAGALGAAGVGAGLAAAEATARSARALALATCGALGGLASGAAAQLLAGSLLSGVFGQDAPAVGGWFEGLILGGAAGIGYAWSTLLLPGGGLAAPTGMMRVKTAVVTGLACGLAALGLTWAGYHLVGSTLDVMASGFQGSDVGLAPLARLLGEETLRPITRALISTAEGFLFGAGLAFGLTHRPTGPA